MIAYLGGVCLANEADHIETELCCFNRKPSLSEEELGIPDDLQQIKSNFVEKEPLVVRFLYLQLDRHNCRETSLRCEFRHKGALLFVTRRCTFFEILKL